MHTLRQKNGLSGFTSRSESEYDPFGAGHGCNSISAGLGNISLCSPCAYMSIDVPFCTFLMANSLPRNYYFLVLTVMDVLVTYIISVLGTER